MSLKLGPGNKVQEIIFIKKKPQSSHPSVHVNNNKISSTTVYKLLPIELDDKLDQFQALSYFFFDKVETKIDVLRKFLQNLPRQNLITIYEPFIWLI